MEYNVAVWFRVKADNPEAAAEAITNYLDDVVDTDVVGEFTINYDDVTEVPS